jgi:membrane protease YdiL (CAAX protease family)
LHPISALYVAFAAGFGACFGGLAVATGGLVAPILAHSLYDFAALLLLRQQARTVADA